MKIRASTLGTDLTHTRHFKCVNNNWLNVISAFFTVLGQVGQNVGLPIWFASVPDGQSLDPYFVLLYTCVWFLILFIFGTFIQWIIGDFSCSELSKFITKRACFETFLVGFTTALNGLFLVFAAPPERTPAFLQSALTNIMIPLVIIMRFIVLRKIPSFLQGIAAFGVICGLFTTAVPTIFNLDPSASQTSQAEGVCAFLWPLIFMLSFIPAALYTVLEELFLSTEIKKQQRQNFKSFDVQYTQNDPDDEYNDDNEDLGSSVDDDFHELYNGSKKYTNLSSTKNEKLIPLSLFFSMVTFFQTLSFVTLFWYDLIPTIGEATSMNELLDNFFQGLKYTILMDGAPTLCLIGFILFVIFYNTQSYGAGLLCRYSEGAVWSAVVSALVTPIGEIFWMLFGSADDIHWNPTWTSTSFYPIIGLFIIVPCVYLYNYESQRQKSIVDHFSIKHQDTQKIHGSSIQSFAAGKKSSNGNNTNNYSNKIHSPNEQDMSLGYQSPTLTTPKRDT